MDPMNNSTAFTPSVWGLLGGTLLSLSFLFFFFHSLYTRVRALEEQKKALEVTSKLDFLIFPFVKMTEPDPLPWFSRASAGKLKLMHRLDYRKTDV